MRCYDIKIVKERRSGVVRTFCINLISRDVR